MDQATLPRSIFFVSDGFGIEPRVYGSKSGSVATYSGVPVFRSGTFRDSMGDQTTWEDLHMNQMVTNYEHLTGKKIIESAPVRNGHPSFIVNNMEGKGNVVGWHESVATKKIKSPVDGQEYTYFLVDYTITEPEADEKIKRGTWRNRSAEIGMYRTNDESEFWPVYLGFAFVDFPAVEGLNFTASQGARCFTSFVPVARHEEKNVTDTTASQAAAGAGTGSQAGGTPLPFGVPAQPQPSPAFVFSMNGTNETDFSKVQAYINQLEGFFQEQRATQRKAFVSGLAAGPNPRIAATQIPELEVFAMGLTDAQYDQWSKSMGPVQPLVALQKHGTGPTNPDNTAQQQATPADQVIETAEQIVKMHQRAGMPEADVKKTPSYQKLVAAGKRQA